MFEKFISLAWHKFTFLQQMNIFARPGNSMATAQFPLYDNQEMLYTSPVSFYAFSLYRFYHSRRHTTFFLRCSTRFFSLFFIRFGKKLPQMIRFIIRFAPYVRSLHACILTVDKARKEILHLMTKVATDRWTHQQYYFVSFCSQFFIFFRLSRALGFTRYMKFCRNYIDV